MTRLLLVGATDGIGRALAEAGLRRGWRVALLGRNAEKLAGVADRLRAAGAAAGAADALTTGLLDVTERTAVGPALDAAAARLGGVDVLVYCAGVMEADPEATERMVSVNLVGAVEVMEWGARHMQAAGAGRLAALGSVAGDRVRKGYPVYGATKAALHAYLEGLRHRLHGTGVGVTTVKPGWVRTRMLGEVPAFPPTVGAERAAESILEGLGRGRDVLYVPWWWRLVSLAIRLMPGFVFKRLAPA